MLQLGNSRQKVAIATGSRRPIGGFAPLRAFGTVDAKGLASRENPFAAMFWRPPMFTTSSLGTQLGAGLLAFLVSATCILFTAPTLI